MTKTVKVTLLVSALTWLSGCAQTAIQPEPATADSSSSAEETTIAAAGESSFEPSTLYSLLVAELAGQRGLPRVTLHNYLQEARNTGDLGLIKRSIQLASELREKDALLEAAMLWTEAEPENPAPYSIASKELIQSGKAKEATPLLEKALQLDSLEVIDTLANRGQSMSKEELATYLEVIDGLLAKTPDNAYLLYAKASLVTQTKDYEAALELTRKALSSDPEYDRAILLEADLQARLGHIDTALGHLREQLGEREHKQFRILYTRLLMEKQLYPQAEEQADLLASLYRDDENILFYLGVLMLEHERLDASERYFSQLSDLTGINGALRYYHGRIAQLRGNKQQALEYYAGVDDPRYLISSYTEMTHLLDQPEDYEQLNTLFQQARQRTPNASPLLFTLESNWLVDHKLLHEAMTQLNQGLEAHPEETRLLYTRAMLWEQLDNLAAMEADLRTLIKLEPENATALNALGYTLTDKTGRHQEAQALIEKALKLKPDDPAILDSMGWVHYHLKDLKLALQYLQRAYEIFPDPEIAAHLGTVQWEIGNHDDAINTWDEALKAHPQHPLLLKARQLANP